MVLEEEYQHWKKSSKKNNKIVLSHYWLYNKPGDLRVNKEWNFGTYTKGTSLKKMIKTGLILQFYVLIKQIKNL